MIILIGGSSHVGKTLLAQKLLERLHYPYLSLDHLKMGLIRSGLTDLTVEDDYEMRYYLWPIAAEMVKTAVENRQDLIVEGCYIPGEWREEFPAEYLKDIRCIFLVMSERYLRENFDAVKENASVIEQRLDDRPDPERLIACSADFREICAQHDIPCLEIDGAYDIERIADEVMERLALR